MNDVSLDNKWIGQRTLRPDGIEKVTGSAQYAADFAMPGMVYGKVLRSPHAHAVIKSIDTSEAEKLKGVLAVMTGDDLPLMPPTTHIMLNTVEAVNLESFYEERFSGLGVPHQVHELAQHPIYLHGGDAEKPRFPRPENFTDISLVVEYADGSREPQSGFPAT